MKMDSAVYVRLPKRLKKKIDKRAQKLGYSQSEYLRLLFVMGESAPIKPKRRGYE